MQKIYNAQKKKSFLKAIFNTYKSEYIVSTAYCMTASGLSYASPFLVHMLIKFLQSESDDNGYAFKILAILVVTQFISYLIWNHMIYAMVMMGISSTNAVISMIYQKQLRLSASTNKTFGQGQITNFVQVDAYKLLMVCFSISNSLQIPVVFTYSFIMLFKILGVSFFSGLYVIVLAFFINTIIGFALKKVNETIMETKDNRMNHTTEAVTNMKSLKLYSWTEIFEAEIHKRRELELTELKRRVWWNITMVVCVYFFPNILSSVVFTTYIGTDQHLDLATAFTVLIFFELMRDPLRILPDFIS